MKALAREDVPIAIEGDGVEFRRQEIGGDLTVAFVHLPQGTDFRPALAGLPDDRCQCPHWGYIINGRLKMYTGDEEEIYEAGQAVYWAPGHAPVALEATRPSHRIAPKSAASRPMQYQPRGASRAPVTACTA